MSTRSQIKIKNSEDNIYIYKHSDGYPEGVIPVLAPFLKDFFEQRGFDECYLLAQIVRRFAVEDFKRMQNDPYYKENPESYKTFEFLGWGLDCVEHGDIEYLYEIDEKGAIWVNGKKLTKTQLKKYSAVK